MVRGESSGKRKSREEDESANRRRTMEQAAQRRRTMELTAREDSVAQPQGDTQKDDEVAPQEIQLTDDEDDTALLAELDLFYERDYVWNKLISNYKPKSNGIYKMPPDINDQLLALNYFDGGYNNAMRSKNFRGFLRPYNGVIVFPMLAANFRIQLMSEAMNFNKFCNTYSVTDQQIRNEWDQRQKDWIQANGVSPLVKLEDTQFSEMAEKFMVHHLQHLASEFFPDVGKLSISSSYIYDLSDLPNGIALKADQSDVTLSVCLSGEGPPFFTHGELTFGRILCKNHQDGNRVHFRQKVSSGQSVLYNGSLPCGFAPNQGNLSMLIIHCRSNSKINVGCWECARNG